MTIRTVRRFTSSGFATIGLGLLIALGFLTLAPRADAAFGLNEVSVSFVNKSGAPVSQAGSHPFALITAFRFNERDDPELGIIPDEEPKNLEFQLPAGFSGNPTATPRCPSAVFAKSNVDGFNECSNSTVIGISKVFLSGKETNAPGERNPVYNLVPAPGTVAKIGFLVHRVPVTVDLGVNGESPNNVKAGLLNIPQAIYLFGTSIEIWGVPAAHVHDEFRGSCLSSEAGPAGEYISLGICEAEGAPQAPFLTLPSSCTGSLTTTYEAVSWLHPAGPVASGQAETPGMTGCDQLGFVPSVSNSLTASSAESPTGLNFALSLVNPGLSEPEGLANSDLEKAVVTLPTGVTTNPSVATGLQACSLAQYHSEALVSSASVGCPDASKVGEVEIETPLLEQDVSEGGGLRVLHGAIYVAKQHENPFNNLLTIYMVVKEPKLGILIKQAGQVEPNALTGQLTTTFDNLPPLPFSNFRLHFREGQRAPLISPNLCGSYQSTATLYPTDHSLGVVTKAAQLSVSTGAGGAPCASDVSHLPNSPDLTAGTVSSKAGAFSPFVFRVARADGTQQLSRISTTLPQGLLGKLAGITYCPEAGIAQAASRGAEGDAAVELTQPSCPASSEVGSVIGSAGAGSSPFYLTTGHAYLAGPYKGAPLSLEIIVPAQAGPFDLGVVAVRTALRVNPVTAQITAVSDPIPTILHGLPLDVRSVSINMNRSKFTLNPTSCEPKEVTGEATSLTGSTALMHQYFQASGCKALPFKPELSLSLQGAVKRSKDPALHAVLTQPKGQAGIAGVTTILPPSEFIDNAHINNPCTRVQFAENACPAKSVLGHATAYSPLLEKPLSGPVYFRSNGGERELPDLVAVLKGQIEVELVGFIDSVHKKGSQKSRIRTRFAMVPDAPVSKFVLKLLGGKRGLLENSVNLCKTTNIATVEMVGQNGKRADSSKAITASCGGGKRKPGHKKRPAR